MTVGANTRIAVDASVAGHRYRAVLRGRRLWSVRTQLLAPILVAILGFAVLGAIQTRSAIAAAADADRAQVLSHTATSTARLVHELERELAETAALRLRGGTAGQALVAAQQRRADAALAEYRTESRAAQKKAPALKATLAAAESSLAQLPKARESAVSKTVATASAGDTMFRDTATSLLTVADALASQVLDPELASAVREVAAVVSVEHLAAVERDLLRSTFSSGSIQAAQVTELSRLEGSRQQLETQFLRTSTRSARETYKRIVAGGDVENATKIIKGVLDASIVKADSDAWYTAQSNTIRRINMVSLSLSERLDDLATSTATNTNRRALITAGGTLVVALLVLSAAVYLAVRTSRRLRSLRAAAFAVARHELPQAIGAVSRGTPLAEAAERGNATRTIAQRLTAAGDEIGEVADAFTTVHRAALRLASEQAALRVDMSRMAEVLARRIRTLVERQLRLLDEFERTETDPDELARLFSLDHLAARMRRNGENLLVLAGGEPGRGYARPYPLGVVVTAAAAEIEQFERVQVEVHDIDITSGVIGDLVHMLAELLENATTFSPPDASVIVNARRNLDGVTVRIHDRGLGIPPQRLTEINQRLLQPVALSSVTAGTMGLHVVSRLAARHGFRVQLHATATGTVAYVELPNSALASAEEMRRLGAQPGRPQLTGPAPTARPAQAALPVTRGQPDPMADTQQVPMLTAVGGPPTDRRLPAGSGGPARDSAIRVEWAGDVSDVGATGVPIQPGSPVQANAAARSESAAQAVVGAGAGGSRPLLPRRRPGTLLEHEMPPAPTPSGLIDPHAVRTRLSALSEGISAAQRRTGTPPVSTKGD